MTDLSSAGDAGKRNVTNRFETVRCQACGRSVARKTRQQRYCSDRCRVYAHRQNAPSQINARTAIKNPIGYPGSADVTNCPKIPSENSSLQEGKPGSSIPINVLGGYRWPGAVSIDRDLLRKIVRAEIGGGQ